MQDSFDAQPDPSEAATRTLAAPLFVEDPRLLRDLIAAYGFDALHAMRDIARQVPVGDLIGSAAADDTRRPMLSAMLDVGTGAPDDPLAAAMEALSLLDEVPPPFSPTLRGPVPGIFALTPEIRAPEGADPRLARLIGLWTALFGGFTPTHRDMGDPVPVYAPLIDYHVDPMVEKSLTLTVDVEAEASAKASFSLTVRNVGLTGSYSEKITHTLDGKPRDHSFQTVVPTFLKLTEYEGPMQGVFAYTAQVVETRAPQNHRPASGNAKHDEDVYVTIPTPEGEKTEGRFLNSDALGEETSEKVEKSGGITASVPLKIEDWLDLSVDFEASARRDVTLSFVKTRADRLMLRRYKGMRGRIEVYPA